MKKVISIISLILLASLNGFAETQQIPKGKSACIAFFSSQMDYNVGGAITKHASYSCDGDPVQILDLSNIQNLNEPRISYVQGLFVQAGYKISNCQYTVGAGVLPQYSCTFTN